MSGSHDCAQHVRAILADTAFDDPANDDSRAEALYALTATHGWDSVRAETLFLLADPNASRHWADAITVLWLGIDQPMPAIHVIARLQLCQLAEIPPGHALDDNLVWSITHTLKRVGYLSDYDPALDPDVLAEMARLSTTR